MLYDSIYMTFTKTMTMTENKSEEGKYECKRRAGESFWGGGAVLIPDCGGVT